MLKEIAIGTEVLVVAEGETLVHIEAHDTEDPVDPEEPEEPEDFVGILIEVIDDLVVIDSKDEGRVIRFYVINDENGAPDREVLAMLKEIAIGTEVLVVAEGEMLVHIEAHDTEDPVDPEEPEEPEDFVGILIEVIDDLVVIDSKDEGRVIRFYILKDEAGAPDREVLAMLKEIAIGTEVLVVAEGETLVHIEAHDTEDPVDPEEPEEPEDFVGILIEVIDDLVVIDSKDEGRVIRFYVIKDENGAPDREVLAMLKEIAIGTEVLVVAEGETLVHIEAHDTEDPVSITGLVTERGEDWLRIISDGNGESIRLQLDKSPEGYDKELSKELAHFQTPNRAYVVMEGESLTHVELLAPDEKSGVLEGVVIDKGEKWIDIDDEEERYRLVPKWIDGPEKRAVELIAKTPKEAFVQISWIFDERYRLSEIEILDDPNSPKEPENGAPSISEGQVSPAQGKTDQKYTFTVHYLDPDGDKPEFVILELDGEEYEMRSELNENQGVDYKAGALFSATIQHLEPGIHFYSFFASDGHHDVETESQKGPMITESPAPKNTKPELSGSNINPEAGNSDSTFTFLVTYFDADGDQPEYVDLRLDDFRFPMEAADEKDPEEGTLYKVTLRGLSAGDHRFSFIASDGIALADTEWVEGPQVEEAERKGELVIWAINEEKTQNGVLRINGEIVEERIFKEGENLLEQMVLPAGEYVVELELENGAIDKQVVKISHDKISEIELAPRFDKETDADEDHLVDSWEQEHFGSLEMHGRDDPDEDGLTNREEYKIGTNPNNADTDGDDLPDEWEMQNQTNPVEADAHEDKDGDLLNNLAEFQNGTKAYSADSDRDGLDDGLELTTHRTNPTKRDTDGDHMPDGWEITYELNPLTADGEADLDDDGLPNFREFRASTDPHNKDSDGDIFPDGYEVENGSNAADAGSTPSILVMDDPEEELEDSNEAGEGDAKPVKRKKRVKIRLRTIPGLRYQIKASQNMKAWSNHGDPIIGKGEALDLLNELQNDPRMFYKVEISDD